MNNSRYCFLHDLSLPFQVFRHSIRWIRRPFTLQFSKMERNACPRGLDPLQICFMTIFYELQQKRIYSQNAHDTSCVGTLAHSILAFQTVKTSCLYANSCLQTTTTPAERHLHTKNLKLADWGVPKRPL